MTKSATDLVVTIREIVNRRKVHASLSTDRQLFNQLCSAMDVIDDCEMAFDSYLRKKGLQVSTGQRYLDVFGLLQALIVQQDALKHLAEAIKVPYKESRDLTAIRIIRNRACHPSRTNDKTFNFISRITLSWRGFQLMTFTPSVGPLPDIPFIDLPALIEKQRPEIQVSLAHIYTEIKSRYNPRERR
jgi:hypothetical protein